MTDQKCSNQKLYDTLYTLAISQGLPCWGGNERLTTGPGQVARILSKPYVPRRGKVFELGCGEGHLCRLLADHGYDVTGIDISSVAIQWAKEKNLTYHTNIRYIHGDISQVDFKVFDHFDMIVDGNCFHCIHGDSREAFLKNIYTFMSDNGIFIVSSLCSRDNENHILFRETLPYRFIPTSAYLQKEVKMSRFYLLDLHINRHEDREFDHINLFLRKT